ncbi:unnamed protein product, partial [Clonostachys chloroleuca]
IPRSNQATQPNQGPNYDPEFESHIGVYRRRQRLLVARSIHFRASRADFETTCRAKLSSWADDEEDPGSNIKRFLADWPQYQERFEAQGMPSYRVIKDTFGNTRLSLVPGPGTMLLAKVFWPKTRLNSSP